MDYSSTDPLSPTDQLENSIFNNTSIQLISTSSDNIMIRTKMYTDMCNDIGIESAQVAYTRVYFNNAPIGFYLIKENTNVQYFEKKYNTSEFYSQMNGHFSPMTYNGDFNLTNSDPTLLNNRTTDNYFNYWYQGKEFPDTFHAKNDLVSLFKIFQKPTSEGEIKKNFETVSFLKNMALDFITNNQHSYLFNGTNYFLYLDTKKKKWNFHEGYYISPFNNWGQNCSITTYDEYRLIGRRRKNDIRRPTFDYLISFSNERYHFEKYLKEIILNTYGTIKYFNRMDSIFKMIFEDLKWDILLEPIDNNTIKYEENSNKMIELLKINSEYEYLKKYITKRKEDIIINHNFIIPFSIYSLFTTCFLISMIIIFVHLFYAVFINPFVWHFSNKKIRVLPSTFLKLWIIALFLFIIICISTYFLIRNDIKSEFFKLIHVRIYRYIINYYGTFDNTYIKFSIVLWLILNRENFIVLFGAPFVHTNNNRSNITSNDTINNSSFTLNNDSNMVNGNSNIHSVNSNLSNNNNLPIQSNISPILTNYSNIFNSDSSLFDNDECLETERKTMDMTEKDHDQCSVRTHCSNCDNDINNSIDNIETMSKVTYSVSEKLSIHSNYNEVLNKEYFQAKNTPLYTDEQSKIIAMYQNIKHGFLIVCHNSSDVLPATLECLLKITIPMCIFIAENGSNSEEKQKMKDIVDHYSNRFRYTHPSYNGLNIIYANLNEGSKTLAQFCLLNNLFWFGINIQYISVIDDDVLIPENWVEDEILSYFKNDPKVKGLAYPINASNRREGIVPVFQNFEYTLAMYSKKVHKDIGTVVFPSGAIGTWSIPFLLECLYRHDTVFRGDDLQIGLRLHTMYGKPRFCNPNEIHEGNYKIEMAHVTVDTVVPRCYIHLKEFLPHCLGKYLKECDCGQYSLSRQRIVYWEPARHRFFFKFLYCILHKCRWNHRATLTAKFFCIDFIVTIINDYLFIILFVFMFLMKSFLPALMIICICFAVAYISLDVFNLVVARGKPTIKLPFEVCVVFPVFYQCFTTLFFRISTIIYTWTYYVPFVRNNVKIKKRALKKNISYMTMSDIITEMDSEKAIANVSDISDYLFNKKQLKYEKWKLSIFKNKKEKDSNQNKNKENKESKNKTKKYKVENNEKHNDIVNYNKDNLPKICIENENEEPQIIEIID
ncbi:hypothetical protein LY90DRAFT_638131 [Neocallimastix californiae]|uniref:Uncharacterized protein n=1 Tax=Neocallimastix californiae TaxID=1754190 RepID=A0A1Y1ZID3_9FUNG|nr:hypothetical protein LY90DRAFT_638131 [Neocallimastix californiae]|eukprot:ORY10020.1 hypothetical protein LY90DRAFT_638131 [Neocallimastix californiae]